MIILHTYLRNNNNIIATIPFRYNNGDDTPVECREVVLDVKDDDTFSSIQQTLMEQIDKEKQNGETDGYSGMESCITIV